MGWLLLLLLAILGPAAIVKDKKIERTKTKKKRRRRWMDLGVNAAAMVSRFF